MKKYKCKFCQNQYEMDVKIYARRSLTGLKKCCTEIGCMSKAAMDALRKKKEAEEKKRKQDWREKKIAFKFETSKQVNEPLQKAINKIARLLDKDQPCLARPFEIAANYDAGHIFSVGSYPALRYNLWNIHKQSVKSNKYLGGEQILMLEGIETRYGLEKRQFIESLPLLYPVLKPTIEQKKEWLKKANKIIRDLEAGENYTRDQINEFLEIYKFKN